MRGIFHVHWLALIQKIRSRRFGLTSPTDVRARETLGPASRAFAVTPGLSDDLRFAVYSTRPVNGAFKLARRRTAISVDAKNFRQILFENQNLMYDVF